MSKRDRLREERLSKVLLSEKAELQSELETAEHSRILGLRLEIQAREMLLEQVQRLRAPQAPRPAQKRRCLGQKEPRQRIDKYSESLGAFSTRPWRKVRTITSSVRMRFWVEAGLAALCGFLGILTLFTRDWIEALTGFDTDNHNGSFEWTIVAALFLVCILLSIAARADWRRLSATAPAGI